MTRLRRTYVRLFLAAARRDLRASSAAFARLWDAWGAWARRERLLLWRLS